MRKKKVKKTECNKIAFINSKYVSTASLRNFQPHHVLNLIDDVWIALGTCPAYITHARAFVAERKFADVQTHRTISRHEALKRMKIYFLPILFIFYRRVRVSGRLKTPILQNYYDRRASTTKCPYTEFNSVSNSPALQCRVYGFRLDGNSRSTKRKFHLSFGWSCVRDVTQS